MIQINTVTARCWSGASCGSGRPNAQGKPATTKKKAKAAAAEASPVPEATPSLEPKAIDILKGGKSSARRSAHTEIQCRAFLRELKPPWSSSRFHHKVRGYSPET